MSSLVIRPCEHADLRKLEWSRQLRLDRILIEHVFETTRDGVGAMLVAAIEREVVGQVWIDVTRKPGVAVLWALRVKRGFRGHGVGSLLIAAAEREGRRQGAYSAELAVELHNARARGLYERLGYRCVGYEIATQASTGAPLGFEVAIMRRSIDHARDHVGRTR